MNPAPMIIAMVAVVAVAVYLGTAPQRKQTESTTEEKCTGIGKDTELGMRVLMCGKESY